MADEDKALPEVGDSLHGFVVVDRTRFDLIGADIVLFEHEKTGALVMYLANEDTNRMFDMVFRTPAETNMGVSHVFEHSTLSGSVKYPSQDLFFALSYQTYNTYMNAGTLDIMTEYPVASLSEEQLLRYADFYTDCCLNPIVVRGDGSSIFEEEAWRYELYDAEGPLTIAGTVYSEMQGAESLESAAMLAFNRLLFPGSYGGNSYGGDPEAIPDMTLEDIVSYHEKYYHPSNSLTFLYGNLSNWEDFLDLLDGYFSAYEKKEFSFEEPDYDPITGAVESFYSWPASEGTSTQNACDVFYGIICEGADMDVVGQLDLLTTLLGDSTSPVTLALRDVLPAASVGCYVDVTSPEPAVIFYAIGVNEEDAQLFRDTVDSSLAGIVADGGFDADAVSAIVQSIRMETLLTSESSTIGEDILSNIAYYWAFDGGVFGYMDYIDSLSGFEGLNADGTFAGLIETWLIGADRTALMTAVPVPGLREERNAQLADRLAEVLAGMTEDEISDLIEKTDARGATDEDLDVATAEYVAQLKAVSVENLPEEVRIYDITDNLGDDGVRRVTAEAGVDGIGTALVLLDASGLTDEQLQYLKLYTDCLLDLDTTEHSRAQLATMSTRYLYNGAVRPSIIDADNDYGFTPYLRVSFTATDEDLQDALGFAYELLYDTNVEDVQRLKDAVSSLRTSMKKDISSNIAVYQAREAFAWGDWTYAAYNWMNGFEYYGFLSTVESLLETDPQAVVDRLTEIQTALHNASGAIVGFAGSAESAEVFDAAVDAAFLSKLDSAEVVPQEHQFADVYPAEAFIIDGNVKYNLIYATYDDLGMDGYNGALDALTSLVTDQFLMPELRTIYGAYGVWHAATEDGVYVISVRDPNIAETYAVYDRLPEFAETLADLDQETLDGYISSAYSYYAQPEGELTGALSALLTHISGYSQEDVLLTMAELKAVTPESLAAYADMYAALLENGIYSTSASASALEPYMDQFDVVLDLFGEGDGDTASAFIDVPADAWYADAVAFAAENELIPTTSDEEFGVDEPAAFGDLAVSFYLMVVGDEGWEDAIPFLGAYGILPGDRAEDASFTREEMSMYIANLCEACGIEVEEASVASFEDADDVTEGLEGIVGWAVENDLLIPTDENLLDPQGTATRLDLAIMLYNFYYGI